MHKKQGLEVKLTSKPCFYEEYDIWIRNVISKPKLSDDRMWTFWQYTNRERLKGYNGKEKYIDVNVFNGSPEAYFAYLDNDTYKDLARGWSKP